MLKRKQMGYTNDFANLACHFVIASFLEDRDLLRVYQTSRALRFKYAKFVIGNKFWSFEALQHPYLKQYIRKVTDLVLPTEEEAKKSQITSVAMKGFDMPTYLPYTLQELLVNGSFCDQFLNIPDSLRILSAKTISSNLPSSLVSLACCIDTLIPGLLPPNLQVATLTLNMQSAIYPFLFGTELLVLDMKILTACEVHLDAFPPKLRKLHLSAPKLTFDAAFRFPASLLSLGIVAPYDMGQGFAEFPPNMTTLRHTKSDNLFTCLKLRKFPLSLTKLNLNLVHPISFADMTSQLSQITTLALNSDDEFTYDLTSYLYPSLTTLRLNSCVVDPKTLATLTNLTNLDICVIDTLTLTSPIVLEDAFLPSLTKLHLKFDSDGFAASVFNANMAAWTNLQHLTITADTFAPSLLPPNLKSLSIFCSTSLMCENVLPASLTRLRLSGHSEYRFSIPITVRDIYFGGGCALNPDLGKLLHSNLQTCHFAYARFREAVCRALQRFDLEEIISVSNAWPFFAHRENPSSFA